MKLRTFCFLIFISGFLSLFGKSETTKEIPAVGILKNMNDTALLETVQRQTFRFFWYGAHPHSGMALERSNTVKCEYYWDYINEAYDEPNLSMGTFGPDACAVGGTGFGIMAIVVATERKWISKEMALNRLIKITDFLIKADSYHGIYPHFIDGNTGKTVPFSSLDNGADIVETSYLLMGLLTARQYFTGKSIKEEYLKKRIGQIWNSANWAWHTNGSNDKLYWHWSPTNSFDMNFPVYGWDEALITYIVAASSAWHPISKEIYENCWVKSPGWKNGKTYYGYLLPLGNYENGGPLFFEQYTFMGIDPNGLTDEYGIDYMQQVTNHTLINRAYCIDNPKKFKGYGKSCWGLTAGDSFKGYVAHCPQEDFGVIQPTAALSSFPFTPRYSMDALRYFYYEKGNKIWSKYGFTDGFSESRNWYATSHLAIDQGPIIVMIENYRTGLIWKLFMSCPEIHNGLKKIGFKSPIYNIN